MRSVVGPASPNNPNAEMNDMKMQLFILIPLILLGGDARAVPPKPARPNVVLLMADDLGWGDVGFNGNKLIRTPNLDKMAAAGLRFQRFYAAAPVCSPTRGSCITGRHPYRYGITSANVGHLPDGEFTLAEQLRKEGYATGHFGKWHLGTLTKTEKDANRGGPGGAAHYAPPWDHGFDVCFSTEAKVPTWNPMKAPGTDRPYGTSYWMGPGKKAAKNLEGDDSRVIMDRVIPFIKDTVKGNKPFLAVVWFHAPHRPVVAGPKYLKLYPRQPNAQQHYYGCITALDEQVGRLRSELRRLGVAQNTMVWFASDNGPEGKAGKAPGSAGPLSGRKRDLLEGGIRVPGLLEWPARVKGGTVTSVPACTSDYLPTILTLLGLLPPDSRPLDGISLVPLIEGRMKERPTPIAFESRRQLALIGNRYKILYQPKGAGRGELKFRLYDLGEDPGEKNDLASKHADVVQRMAAVLGTWRKSCQRSLEGTDYRLGDKKE
jgi:arylsulfatase